MRILVASYGIRQNPAKKCRAIHVQIVYYPQQEENSW